jgi:regulator of replication initiation timing
MNYKNNGLFEKLDELADSIGEISSQLMDEIKKEVWEIEIDNRIFSLEVEDRKKQIICNFIDEFFKNRNKNDIASAKSVITEIAMFK